MSSKSLVVAIVAAGTITAAGAGSYLAVRSNDVSARQARGDELAAPAPDPEPGTTATSVAVEPVEAPAPPVASPAPPDPPRTREVERPRQAPPRRAPATAAPAPLEDPTPAVVPPPPASPPPPPPVEALPVPAPATTIPMQEPPPRFEEIVVEENSVIGIRLDSPISTETARVEDKVTARVSRDLSVDGRTAIPAGSRLEGTVTMVDRGGKFRERARLGIRFTTLVLVETRQAIQTDTIFREGESPAKESTSKVGASAVVGAILGAVVGGKKGAVIGGAAGAAGGTAAVMAGGPQDVLLPAGTPLTVRVTSPVTVLIERNQ